MSDFLTTGERAAISGDMDMIFDTMSKGRTITIVKSPIKTVIQVVNNNNAFGFGDDQQEPIYSYTPVSGVFPAIIVYPRNHLSPLSAELNARIYAGKITIKVKQDCRDFLRDANAVNTIILDGKNFDIEGEERRQMFLNDTYYLFDLEATK